MYQTIKFGGGSPPRLTSLLLTELSKGLVKAVGMADDLGRLEQDYEAWLLRMFPGSVWGFSAPQREFWEWVWRLKGGGRPRPFIGIWPRGGGKSTSAELAVAALAALGVKSYVWYVRATQEMADTSVGTNIMSLLESPVYASYYPAQGTPSKNQMGSIRGWRRQRLSTESGITIDALGLDTAFRGGKIDEQRPDLIVFDDIDDVLDTTQTTNKKEKVLTKSLLPAGSNDVAILGIQNLMIPDGLFARIANRTADYLVDAIVSGPYPAIQDLTYEIRPDEKDGGRLKTFITGGKPLWPEGQSLEIAQQQIRDWGLSAFLEEAQQEVLEVKGGIWEHIPWMHCRSDEVPDLVEVQAWIDPAVTSNDGSDSCAIQIDGIAEDGTIYRLFSWEQVASPEEVLIMGLRKAIQFGASHVGIETDQGGDTWISVAKRACAIVGFKPPRNYFLEEKAGSGYGPKAHRQQQMIVDYENGRVIHVVGTHSTLEKALRRFGIRKPYDLADAGFWSWNSLRNNRPQKSLYKAALATGKMRRRLHNGAT